MPAQHSQHDRSRFDRPEDPFKALGNETRLEILRALYERGQETGAVHEETLPYAELREAVGIEDKGNFNYHLRQLDGAFLESVDEADGGRSGYRLTFAGFEIAKVIDIDAWRSHDVCGPTKLPIGSDADDSPLTAVYEDSVVTVSHDGDPLYAHAVRPAGAADREMELEELLSVASTLWRHTVERILEGICPYCHATVERSLEVGDGPDRYWQYTFGGTCTECGPLGGSHVGVAVLSHPAVVSLFWEHGIDLADWQVWNVPFVTDDAVTVVDDEPTRLRIDVECNVDRLAVFVDDSVRVVDTERLE
ncbi:winged helix-turn-helix transcriptional regulator [Natronolimnobius sp. AArcel1]|uniref:winged helix-turn-helix domain-containing protein n=1 Tax=Natronolimnobius sp. AArcel1 TaxID=1679093 RepID=UPI0013ECD7E9|nr:winged helix-turn-helix domain-containing protein [Natronolimnobius sp. AArcel1]NGM69630.1 winged helix-turn-helix transcriptional regulator [Natronolimnobius sp. AArcel1]